MGVGTIATVVLDDVDITELCTAGSVTHRLNRIGTASVTVNMQAFAAAYGTTFPGAGSYLKVYLENDILGTTPVLYHHGRVLECETTASEDGGYTVFNSSDPLELWLHRPVRNWEGDFSKPNIGLLAQPGGQLTYSGAEMIHAMCENSECAGPLTPPSDCEGPLRLQLGGVASSSLSADLRGAPTDWPMTMAQFASLLVSTGTVDIIVDPIEFDASDNYGLLTLYNGDYGQDLLTSVAFQYGMGAFNVRALRWNENMTNMCNKLWYYLGPKCDDRHWQANVTGDDQAFNPDATNTGAWVTAHSYSVGDVATRVLNGVTVKFVCTDAHTSSASNKPGTGQGWPSFWTYWMVPPGGDLSPPASATNNQIGVLRYQSQQEFDVRMDIQIFDALGDETDCVSGNTQGYDLYRRQWQMEAWLRAQPLNLIHITPTRDVEIGAFDIGDLVLVEAASEVKGGFSGGQRIYEYTISWDAEDSVPALSELQVSSDAEGFDT